MKAIYQEGELDPQAICKEFLQVQSEVFHQHRLAEEVRDERLADDAELKRFLEGTGKLKKDD